MHASARRPAVGGTWEVAGVPGRAVEGVCVLGGGRAPPCRGMHPIDSFSATTASIHLLFCANTIPSHTYFRVGQATGLNSEAGDPSAKSCKKIMFFLTRTKISRIPCTLFRMLPI